MAGASGRRGGRAALRARIPHEWLRDVAPPITALVDAQPPQVQDRVWAKVTQAWAPYTTADGRVRLENQAVWVTGTK